MKLTAADYARATLDALQSTRDQDHDLVLDNLVRTMAENGDAALMEEVYESLAALLRALPTGPLRPAEVTAHLDALNRAAASAKNMTMFPDGSMLLTDLDLTQDQANRHIK